MRKILVSLLVLLPLMGLAAEKQGEASGYMAHMAKRLSLTEEQTQQMRDILRNHRQQMRALRESTEQKVNALLTEEQRTTLQELKDERQEKRDQKHEPEHDHEGEARQG